MPIRTNTGDKLAQCYDRNSGRFNMDAFIAYANKKGRRFTEVTDQGGVLGRLYKTVAGTLAEHGDIEGLKKWKQAGYSVSIAEQAPEVIVTVAGRLACSGDVQSLLAWRAAGGNIETASVSRRGRDCGQLTVAGYFATQGDISSLQQLKAAGCDVDIASTSVRGEKETVAGRLVACKHLGVLGQWRESGADVSVARIKPNGSIGMSTRDLAYQVYKVDQRLMTRDPMSFSLSVAAIRNALGPIER